MYGLGRLILDGKELEAAAKWNRDVGYAKYGWRTRAPYYVGPGDVQLVRDIWALQHLYLGCKGTAESPIGDCVGRDGRIGKQTMQMIADAVASIQPGKNNYTWVERLQASLVLPAGIVAGSPLPAIPCADLAPKYRARRSDCAGTGYGSGGGSTGGSTGSGSGTGTGGGGSTGTGDTTGTGGGGAPPGPLPGEDVVPGAKKSSSNTVAVVAGLGALGVVGYFIWKGKIP